MDETKVAWWANSAAASLVEMLAGWKGGLMVDGKVGPMAELRVGAMVGCSAGD